MGVQFRKLFNWFVCLLGGVADDGERGEGYFIMVADDQENGREGDGDQLHGGLHEDIRQHGVFDGTEISVGFLRELLAFVIFRIKGFHNADTGEVLRHFRNKQRYALQDFALITPYIGGKPKDRQDTDGHRDNQP